MARTAEDIMAELTAAKLKLSSDESEIGDYKIMKTYEARLKGEDDPYDTDALIASREAKREEINTLQQELDAYVPTEESVTVTDDVTVEFA